MTEQTDAAEVLTMAESNALCEALDADGCHGFLNDHVETLAALARLFAVREAAAEARGAQAVLAAVEELHYTVDGQWCQKDGFAWPCGTLHAARAAARGVEGSA